MKNGFSLVELSIVLVILGLLTGGILSGQSLIRAAELRSVTTEFQAYQTAIFSFRDRYFALPGDMPNAISFWGELTTTNCWLEPSTDATTCNGNGNGILTTAYSGNIGTREGFRAWQHLANAGLIEGSYTGAPPSVAHYRPIAGENAPKARIGGGGAWCFFSLSPAFVRGWTFDPNTTSLGLGLGKEGGNVDCSTSIMKADELWNIDSKVDDGKPSKGFLQSHNSVRNNGCTTSDDMNLSEYALNGSSVSCSPLFLMR